jgi:hypothetical protein
MQGIYKIPACTRHVSANVMLHNLSCVHPHRRTRRISLAMQGGACVAWQYVPDGWPSPAAPNLPMVY